MAHSIIKMIIKQMGADLFTVLTSGSLFIIVLLQLITLLLLQNAGGSNEIEQVFIIVFVTIILLLVSYGSYLVMDWIAGSRTEYRLTSGRTLWAMVFCVFSGILILVSVSLTITAAVKIAHVSITAGIVLLSITCIFQVVYMIFIIITMLKRFSEDKQSVQIKVI